jgi:hypothetical protein
MKSMVPFAGLSAAEVAGTSWAPLSFSGRLVPRPPMSRSITVKMRPSPNQLKPFDKYDRAFIIAREAIPKWAARCTLPREPEMPAGRRCDNWRPLLVIADDLGYGESARAAAVALLRSAARKSA